MRIGIIGAGNIGGNCAQRFIVSGKHEVKLSFSRDPANLARFARQLGDDALGFRIVAADPLHDLLVLRTIGSLPLKVRGQRIE